MKHARRWAIPVLAALALVGVPLASAGPPIVTGVSPTIGKIGTSVTITGTDLTGAIAVTFNGTAAGFTVNMPTQITATVPGGATSGPVSVTTPDGIDANSTFTVTAPPSVSGYTPTSAPIGTSVTITGTDLTGAIAVTFNGTAASFTVNTPTQITATVPGGATRGPVSVTTPGGSDAGPTFTIASPPNVSGVSPTIVLTPPSPVQRVTARAGDRTIVLTWARPTAKDLASIRITRSIVGEKASTTVYQGLGTAFTNRGLQNGIVYRYVLVALDKAGNTSAATVVTATPVAPLLVNPRPDARIVAPPLLRWARVPAARYYNVQLYRNGVKVLSAWPAISRLQLTQTWTYDKRSRKLSPDRYTWYVWPGVGDRAAAVYGQLIGKSSFVVVAPRV